MKINRRDTIKLVTATLAAPWLAAMNQTQAAEGSTTNKRVLIFMDPYGRFGERTSSPETNTSPWITDETGDYDLTEEHLGWMLNPLARHLEELSVISGITMKSRTTIRASITHRSVNSFAMTGSQPGNDGSAAVCAHPAIHHYLGAELNARSTVKSVYHTLSLGGIPGNYGLDGYQLPNVATPDAVYSSLFGMNNEQELKAQRAVIDRIREQIGIIAPDIVQGNSSNMMDAYSSSVQAIADELELRGSLQCGDKTPEGVLSNWSGALSLKQMINATFDLFSCGLTSSIALGYGNSGNHSYLVDNDLASEDANASLISANYHGLSHRGTHLAGVSQGIVMRGQITELARLVDMLKLTPEIDGSGTMMMDNTVILYHQVMSSPTHKTTVPYYNFMLAGNNTNVRQKRHSSCFDHSDNELWTTLAQAVGLPTQQFGGYKSFEYLGDSINTGPISKVLKEVFVS